jgi:hypothetical protein
MDTPELVVTQDTQAVTQESAPVAEVAVQDVQDTPVNAVQGDSAPPQVDEPDKEPKVVQELKAQRKKRQQAEQEAAYWRGVAEASRVPEPAAQPEMVPSHTEAPRLEDYEDIEAFEAANVKYIIQQAEMNIERKLQQKQVEESTRQIEATFQKRMADAAEIEPDLADIISDPTLPVSGDMANIIKRSDKSVELIKYLNLNRDTAKRMMHLSAHEVGYELGKIEAAFARQEKAIEPPKKVSMAPEPIQTVTPVGISDPDPETMPIEEWMRKFGGPQRR